MADATKSRGGSASRAEEPRSAIVTYLDLAEDLSAAHEVTELAPTRFKHHNIGPRVEMDARTAWISAYQQVMFLHPESDHDTMLLAVHTAAMAEQLDGLREDNTESQGLLTGLQVAMESIAARLVRKLGPAAFSGLPRGMADLIQRMLVRDDDRRAEAEGE